MGSTVDEISNLNSQGGDGSMEDLSKLNEKALIALNKAGLLQRDFALFICGFIGKELQGVPSQYRKLSISRLRNKATMLEKEGVPSDYIQLINALCDSWENFN